MEQKQFDELCTLYESSLRLLDNPTCEKCEAKVRNPLSVWHVGKSFQMSAIRVLFVGKPHRGTPGFIRPSGLIDPRKRVEELKEVSWAYWSYTREIGKKLFPDENDGWNRIALTNLVKCTSVSRDDSSVDQTTEQMVQSCVLELGVLSAEIQILKPTHLVFYTASLYPGLLSNLTVDGQKRWRDLKRETVKCGQKNLLWWDRETVVSWGPVRALVTGHPERMQKETFTQLISVWAQSPSN